MNSHVKNERGAVLIIELIVLAVVLTVSGIAVFRYYEHRKAANVAAAPVPRTPAPTADPYSGWKTYKLVKEGLTIRYPATWELTEYGPAQYSFGGFKLVGLNDFVIYVEVKLSPQDGALPPLEKIFSDEIKSSNYGKPLYVNGVYVKERNCCDYLTIHDGASINGGYRSKITEHIPGYARELYENEGSYNWVQVTGRYYKPGSHPKPSDSGNWDSDKPHIDSDPTVQEARKILGSLKYE
jgi:hypothetical protein